MKDKHRTLKRFLAFLLSFAMVVTYMPMSVIAFSVEPGAIAVEEISADAVQTAAPEEEAQPEQTEEAAPADSEPADQTPVEEKVEVAAPDEEPVPEEPAEVEATQPVTEVAPAEPAVEEEKAEEEFKGDTLEAKSDNYKVTVTYGADAKIPEGAKLKITEFAKGSDEYEAAKRELLKDTDGNSPFSEFDENATDEDLEGLGMAAFDLTIYDKDGNPIEPDKDSQVQVNVELIAMPEDADADTLAESMEIQHLNEKSGDVVVEKVATVDASEAKKSDNVGEIAVVNERKEIADVEFKVDGFSTYTITWTSGTAQDNTTTLRWRDGNNTRAYLTVHYVDKNGTPITRPGTIGYTVDRAISNNGATVTVDLESVLGLTASGYSFLAAYSDSSLSTEITTAGAHRIYHTGYGGYYTSGVTLMNGSTTVSDTDLGYNNANGGDIYLVYDAEIPQPNTTVHYGYMDGTTFVEFEEQPSPVEPRTSHHTYLIYDFDGYEYADETYYRTTEAVNGANMKTGATEIQARLAHSNANGWRYSTGATGNNWNNHPVEDGSHIYVVYEKSPTPTQGGSPTIEEDTPEPDSPAILKESTSNGDGTNTIGLSIRGSSVPVNVDKLADVIVVFDVSGSMERDLGSNTERDDDDTRQRLRAAKDAVKALASDLLSSENVNSKGEKLIRMGLVTFSTNAQKVTFGGNDFTTNPTTFNNAIEALGHDGGTNWEKALKIANEMSVERETFVIFVTDGDPTFRISRMDATDAELQGDLSGYDNNDTYYVSDNIFGQGNSDNADRNYDAALEHALKIVANDKHFYTIGISSDVEKMSDFASDAGADGNYSATNATELEEAFEKIKESISASMGFSNVDMHDGITNLTNTVEKTGLVSADGKFTYYKAPKPAGWDTWTEAQKAAYTPPESAFSEWTTREADGCAPAVYKDGAVEWEMGSEFMLEDGVTYKVTFTAWPSQHAYDIIADLNNGKPYSDLTEAEQKQIVPAGSGYALVTNEPGANTKYNSAIKSSGNVTVGDAQEPLKFNPVQPMGLTSDDMSVVKEWVDSINPRNRADGVEFYLLVNGKYYQKDGSFADAPNADTYIIDVRANSSPAWTEDIDIATGLAKGGEILETGHDYTIEEYRGYMLVNGQKDYDKYQQYSMEFASQTVRPMLINGQATYLIKIDEQNQPAAGDTKYTLDLSAKTITEGGASPNYYAVASDSTEPNGVITATNYKTSELDITKAIDNTVVGKTEDELNAETFTYKVTLELPEGTDTVDGVKYWIYDKEGGKYTLPEYAGDASAYAPYGYTANTRYAGTNGDTSTDVSFAGGKAEVEVTINRTQIIRFTNLPTGAKYTIVETKANGNDLADEGYSVESVASINGSSSKTTIDNDTLTGEIEDANTRYYNKFTNKLSAIEAELKVKKTTSGYEWKTGDSYEFTITAAEGTPMPATTTVTVTDEDATDYTKSFGKIKYTEAGTYTYTITETGAGTIKDSIRYGASKTVTVTVELVNGSLAVTNISEGYEAATETTPASGTVEITNTFEPTTANATKAWLNADGTTGAPTGATVEFTLYADGTATEYKVTLDGEADTAPTGTAAVGYEKEPWKAEFVNLPKYKAGASSEEITYTIGETAISVKGYTMNPTTPVASGGTITNTQTSTTKTITKKWADNYDLTVLGITSVTVQLKMLVNGVVTEITGQAPVELNAGNNWTYTFTGLPKIAADTGAEIQYIVEEIAVNIGSGDSKTDEITNPDGSKTKVIDLFDVTDGTDESGDTITNTRATGYLKVTKTVTGDLALADLPDEAVFTITGPADYGTNGSKTLTGAQIKAANGVYTEEVPVGTYTVTETDAEVTGYDLTTTYSPANGEAKVTKTSTEAEPVTVGVTNNYSANTFALVVTKTFEGNDGNLPATTGDDAYAITVSYKDADMNDATATLKLTDAGAEKTAGSSYEWTVTGVRFGTTATATEANEAIDSYTLDEDASTKTGTCEIKTTGNSIALKNVYTRDTADLKIKKVIANGTNAVPVTEADIAGATFAITGPSDFTSQTVTYEDFAKDEDQDSTTYTLKDVPTGTYTVVESNAGVTGYSVVTTYDAASEDGQSGTAVVEKDQTTAATVTVTNTYTANPYDIKVVKTFEDITEDLIPDDFKVTVKDGDATLAELTTSSTGVVKDGLTYTWTVSGAKFGDTVTAKETGYTITGYTWTGTTDEGSVTVEVPTATNNTITLTNPYEINTHKVTVEKTFSGITEAEIPEDFKITTTYDEMPELNADNATTVDGLKYTWEITDVDYGTEIEFTESDYDVEGYTATPAVVVTGATNQITDDPTKAKIAVPDGDATVSYTNTYTANPYDIKVVKKFEDITEDLIPDDFKVTVKDGDATLAELTTGTTGVVKSEDGLTYTWTVSGAKFGDTVTAKETGITISGYTWTGTTDEGSVTVEVPTPTNNTITLTNPYETTSYSVEKVWSDNDDQDGRRPDTIKVQLYQNDTAYGDPVELTRAVVDGEPVAANEDSRSNTWPNLETKDADGNAYTYTVKELDASGAAVENRGALNADYTATYAHDAAAKTTTITNTHTPDTVDKVGTKIWSDNNNATGVRPETITVQLIANAGTAAEEIARTVVVRFTGTLQEGEVQAQKADEAGNTWNFTFEGVDKYKDGAEIIYSIVETVVPTGYTKAEEGMTVTNTLTEYDVIVEKTFVGITEDLVPTDFTVTPSFGETAQDALAIADADHTAGTLVYTWTLEDVPYGTVVSVTEDGTDIEGWTLGTPTISDPITVTTNNQKLTLSNPYTINKHKVTVTKKFDGITKEEIPADFQIATTYTGKPVLNTENATTVSDDELTYTWEINDVNYGTEIEFTESNYVVTGYTETPEVAVTGTVNQITDDPTKAKIAVPDEDVTVDYTNTYASTHYSVEKAWNDLDNADGVRPESIKVQLFDKNDEPYGAPVTLTAEMPEGTSWYYEWPHLETKVVDKETGELVDATYYVRELDAEGNAVGEGGDLDENYTASYVDGESGTAITNSHQTKPVKTVDNATTNKTEIDGSVVSPGDVLTYTISTTNTTGKEATVTITDTVPQHTTIVEGSAKIKVGDGEATTEGVTVDGRNITWTVADVANGTTVTATFQVTVDADDAPVIENTGHVRVGNNEQDTNKVVNSKPHKDVDNATEGKEEQKVDGKTVEAGDVLTYRIQYKNATGKPADVTITDSIPANTTYVDGSAKVVTGPEAEIDDSGDITWKFTGVPADTSIEVSFQVKVNDTVSGETIVNDATVTEGENTAKTNEVTNPTPPKKDVYADGDTSTSIDGETVHPGDTLEYQITYKNSTDKEESVYFTDVVPQYTTYVEGSAAITGSKDDASVVIDATESDGKTTIAWGSEEAPVVVPAAADGTPAEVVISFKVTVDKDSEVLGQTLINEADAFKGENKLTTNQVTNPVQTDLKLKKAINAYVQHKADKVSFGFEVVGYDKDGKETFRTILGLDFTSDGKLANDETVENLPVETVKVVATEVYSGGYVIDGKPEVTTTTLNEDGIFEVEFKNKVDNIEYNTGVTNKFQKPATPTDSETTEPAEPTPPGEDQL